MGYRAPPQCREGNLKITGRDSPVLGWYLWDHAGMTDVRRAPPGNHTEMGAFHPLEMGRVSLGLSLPGPL